MPSLSFLVLAPAEHAVTLRTFSLLDQQLIVEATIDGGAEYNLALDEGMALTLTASTLPVGELIYATASAGPEPAVATLFALATGDLIAEHVMPALAYHTFAMSEGLAIGARGGTIDYAAIDIAERNANITSDLL